MHVTEVGPGDQGAWSGKGYLDFSLPFGEGRGGANLAIKFDNILINDCYEMSRGKVEAVYDPNKQLLDVDEIIGSLESHYQHLVDFMRVYSGTPEDKKRLAEFQKALAKEQQAIQQSSNYSIETKNVYTATVTRSLNSMQCLVPRDSVARRGRLAANECDYESTLKNLEADQDSILSNVWVEQIEATAQEPTAYQMCVFNITYNDIAREPSSSSNKSIKVRLRNAQGVEVATLIAKLRGGFYHFVYNNDEYFYGRKLCNGQDVAIVRQWTLESSPAGVFSYFDYGRKQYISYVPRAYPTDDLGRLLATYGSGLAAFADVNEAVYKTIFSFMLGGPAARGVVAAAEWVSFGVELGVDLNTPQLKATPEGRAFLEQYNILQMAFSLSMVAANVGKLEDFLAKNPTLPNASTLLSNIKTAAQSYAQKGLTL